MNKRESPRYSRHIQVRFGAEGDDTRRAGFTTNISRTGAFIRTNFPSRPGTRLVVEAAQAEHWFAVVGQVVHAAKVAPALEKVRPSGMGIRFLPIDELVDELLVAGQRPKRSGEKKEDESKKPKAPVIQTFQRTFEDAHDFARVLRKDIAEGGLFLPTNHPVPVQSEVDVTLVLPKPLDFTVETRARVVLHLPGGMGLAFVEPLQLLDELEPLLQELDL